MGGAASPLHPLPAALRAVYLATSLLTSCGTDALFEFPLSISLGTRCYCQVSSAVQILYFAYLLDDASYDVIIVSMF